MRILTSLIAAAGLAGLAACAPNIPDSAAGVGFESYDRYLADRAARDRQLAQGNQVPQPITPPALPQTAAASQSAAPLSPAEQTAADALAAIRPQTGPAAAAPAVPVVQANNAGISDEQDFDAVASRQSITSDAQRRAQQSAQYEVIAPTAVPRRPGDTTPTPIEFALQVRHPVGQKVYSRSLFGAQRLAENCSRYASDDQAQDAFLQAGGPERDKLKIDPDGDGYACNWNPAKYRQIVRG